MDSIETNPPTNSIYLGSTRAQHELLVAQSAVVMRLGQLLLKSGASAFRVKNSMARLAQAVGLEEHHSQVTFTEITTSAYSKGNFRTEIAEQRVMGISAYRIDLLGDFVSHLPEKISPGKANEELDRIENLPHLYTRWMLTLASAFACAGFAFLNRGGWIECGLVFLAAGLGQFLRATMMKRSINHIAIWFACGVAAAGLYIGLVGLCSAMGWMSVDHMVGFISAILFLVPGFPLVTGMLDLARMDFGAGLARLTYVALLLVSASFAVWLLVIAFDLPLRAAPQLDIPHAGLVALRVLASFVAAYGFAMLFSAMPLSALWAGLIAAIVNPARIMLTEMGLAPHLSVVLAAFVAALLAEIIAPVYKRRFSRISLSVPAVVTMVPGVAFYTSMANFSNGDVSGALDSAVQVFMIFMAIGVGLVAARFLMDRNWIYNRDIQNLKNFKPTEHTR